MQPTLSSLIRYRMETLDEFDNGYPLSVSFCKLISLEEFEKPSLSYTQQCLHELYSGMEQNPRICERALRNQKQMEKEAAGLVSYLKKRKHQPGGIWHLKAAKTGKGQHWKKHTLQDRFNQLHSKVLEPPKFTMPRVFGLFPEFMNKQGERALTSSPDLKYRWTVLKPVSQKSMANSHPIVLSLGDTHSSLQADLLETFPHLSLLAPLAPNLQPLFLTHLHHASFKMIQKRTQ